MIKALIFDFDGLILDTETADYQSWQETFAAHGCPLPLSKWAECIGTMEAFDPYDLLEECAGRPLEREAVCKERRARFDELMAERSALPGVESYIHEARRLGLKLGIASSASRQWVVGNLTALGLAAFFDHVVCGDEVERTKPDPSLYLLTLHKLGVRAGEAIALEDSPNGVLAAKRAGIFCVAVPNGLTGQLSLDHADLIVPSLADLPLAQLLEHIASRRDR